MLTYVTVPNIGLQMKLHSRFLKEYEGKYVGKGNLRYYIFFCTPSISYCKSSVINIIFRYILHYLYSSFI